MPFSEIDILSIIPQRAPFVMVDQLTACDEMGAKSVFLVRKENILVREGKLSEAGLVENIAQTAAAHSGWLGGTGEKKTQIGYIGDVKNLEIYDLPKTNSILETQVKVKNQIFDITVIEGKVTCEGKLIAECEMKIFISNKP
ncbi:MAG: 3-hydroxyacyl-ACP dehydratase [Bacteroidetes bacterium]|nr:3-hydroxyacyl-ACP dehydratase [Bacteroidota bacterium]